MHVPLQNYASDSKPLKKPLNLFFLLIFTSTEIHEKHQKYAQVFIIHLSSAEHFCLVTELKSPPIHPLRSQTPSEQMRPQVSRMSYSYSSHISQCSPTVITNYPISVFLSNQNRIQLSSHELRDSPEWKLLHGFHLSCSETQQPLSYGPRSEARENGGQKGMFLKGCLWNGAWWSVWVVGFISWHRVCGVYQPGVVPEQEVYLSDRNQSFIGEPSMLNIAESM